MVGTAVLSTNLPTTPRRFMAVNGERPRIIGPVEGLIFFDFRGFRERLRIRGWRTGWDSNPR